MAYAVRYNPCGIPRTYQRTPGTEPPRRPGPRENGERSDLHFQGYISKALQIPNIYTEETRKRFEEIVSVTYGICEKVIGEYVKHESYRALFGFSKEAEELILLDPGYPCALPLARFDLFYHEDTGEFWFCEFSTDGSTGMNESRLQDAFMIHNPAHQEMLRRYHLQMMELMDSWVRAFLDIYSTYDHRIRHPNIAIIDFLEKGICANSKNLPDASSRRVLTVRSATSGI